MTTSDFTSVYTGFSTDTISSQTSLAMTLSLAEGSDTMDWELSVVFAGAAGSALGAEHYYTTNHCI